MVFNKTNTLGTSIDSIHRTNFPDTIMLPSLNALDSTESHYAHKDKILLHITKRLSIFHYFYRSNWVEALLFMSGFVYQKIKKKYFARDQLIGI